MLPRRFKRAVVMLAVAMQAAAGAHAVSVSPVKLELMPSQRATQLSISNPSDAIRTYDIRVQKWDGVDQVTARSITSDLTSSPVLLSRPVVTLPPRSKSTIRIAVAQRSENASDYYRLLIDDITPPAANESGESTANLRVSVSLPLQVRNKNGIQGQLAIAENGLANVGNNIVSVLSATRSDGTADSSVSRYLLPGEVWATSLQPADLSWLKGLQ